ncbi:MAG: DUF2891 domain-containing protein [Kofleriaceae bacterium]
MRSRFAQLALACVQRELPHKLDHVATDAAAVTPRVLHPAFYGCFDWHSAVHGHWLLVRLLRGEPISQAAAIRAALSANLTAGSLAVEAAYFTPERRTFERPYGWAWLLQLATELHGWDDRDGVRWAAALQPLADVVIARYLGFLPVQQIPVRTGVHANTAFGLCFALDHARVVRHGELERLIVERALTYYAGDVAYPAAWEPSGEDFLSPALVEADLIRRVLPPARFASWLHAFLPEGLPAALATPVRVPDRSDPKLAHLDGLNLSRAWCLRAIAAALPAGDPLRGELATAAELHATAGLAHVATGDYAGEHWLASFAAYLSL